MEGFNKDFCWFLVFSGKENQNGFMSFIDYNNSLNEVMLLFTTKAKADKCLAETDSIGEYISRRITWKEAYEIASQEDLDMLIDNIYRVMTVWVDRGQQTSLFSRN
jgi:hypothetical protein